MAQTSSGRHRSIARAAASVLLLVLALIYAGITALFVLLVPSSRITLLNIGNDIVVLYSDFAYNGIVVFLASCLLSGYAGVAVARGTACRDSGSLDNDRTGYLRALDLWQHTHDRFALSAFFNWHAVVPVGFSRALR